MMKLEGIAAFVAVAQAGSISEAARRAGLAKSVVSERLGLLDRRPAETLPRLHEGHGIQETEGAPPAPPAGGAPGPDPPSG